MKISGTSTTTTEVIDNDGNTETTHLLEEKEYYHKNTNTNTKNNLQLELERTEILLPNYCNNTTTYNHNLHLPKTALLNNDTNSRCSSTNIDEYLGTIDCIKQSNKKLIEKGSYDIVCGNSNNNENDVKTKKNNVNRVGSNSNNDGIELVIDDEDKIIKVSKVLYVCQREVGHTTPYQNDIIVSDDVTTCHILSILSYTKASSNKKSPLSSLAHIDKPEYESCIRRMIQTHKEYHHNHDDNKMIYMHIHILGGFIDDDGSSYDITRYLLSLLTIIASQEKKYNNIHMILQTCLVSSLNHNHNDNDPIIGRGLAMNTKTGEIYLIKSTQQQSSSSTSSPIIGPEIILRSCRIYAHENDKLSHDKLSLIHTYNNNINNNNTTTSHNTKTDASSSIIYINPIKYKYDNYYNFLSSVKDNNIILNLCSTSPKYERDDFCDNLRNTILYIRDHNCYDTFGNNCDCILRYDRVWNNDLNCFIWINNRISLVAAR